MRKRLDAISHWKHHARPMSLFCFPGGFSVYGHRPTRESIYRGCDWSPSDYLQLDFTEDWESRLQLSVGAFRTVYSKNGDLHHDKGGLPIHFHKYTRFADRVLRRLSHLSIAIECGEFRFIAVNQNWQTKSMENSNVTNALYRLHITWYLLMLLLHMYIKRHLYTSKTSKRDVRCREI